MKYLCAKNILNKEQICIWVIAYSLPAHQKNVLFIYPQRISADIVFWMTILKLRINILWQKNWMEKFILWIKMKHTYKLYFWLNVNGKLIAKRKSFSFFSFFDFEQNTSLFWMLNNRVLWVSFRLSGYSFRYFLI